MQLSSVFQFDPPRLVNPHGFQISKSLQPEITLTDQQAQVLTGPGHWVIITCQTLYSVISRLYTVDNIHTDQGPVSGFPQRLRVSSGSSKF